LTPDEALVAAKVRKSLNRKGAAEARKEKRRQKNLRIKREELLQRAEQAEAHRLENADRLKAEYQAKMAKRKKKKR
jgi:hypothetical protein